MGVLTNLLKLLKPGENDYYNQQTEQADNWQKVDDYAIYTDRDKNAVWGGLDGGGLIEDPTVIKEVGKRYIGADGKAYICLVPSDINNSTNYTPCNTVDNNKDISAILVPYRVDINEYAVLYNGKNLLQYWSLYRNRNIITLSIDFVSSHITGITGGTVIGRLPVELRPKSRTFSPMTATDKNLTIVIEITTDGYIKVVNSSPTTTQSYYGFVTYFV